MFRSPFHSPLNLTLPLSAELRIRLLFLFLSRPPIELPSCLYCWFFPREGRVRDLRFLSESLQDAEDQGNTGDNKGKEYNEVDDTSRHGINVDKVFHRNNGPLPAQTLGGRDIKTQACFEGEVQLQEYRDTKDHSDDGSAAMGDDVNYFHTSLLPCEKL